MRCDCFEHGYFHLLGTSRGDVDLNLKDRQIELDDAFDKQTINLLTINFCPVCGQDLREDVPEWVKSTKAFNTKFFNVGEAYRVESISSKKVANVILESCEESCLRFIALARGTDGCVGATSLHIRPKDINTTKITKLIVKGEE